MQPSQMAAADRSRHRRRLLALVLLAPLTLSVWWFWRRPVVASPSRFDEELDRAIAPVLEQHAAQIKLGISTPTQARLLARQLAQDSAPYLAPADLELWAAIRLEAARASPVACARLWKGGDDAALGQAIAGLGDERLTAWTEMLARGLSIRLERKPSPEISAGALPRGMAAIVERLAQPERAAFEADITRSGVSDTRACELFVTLSMQGRELEPALRTELYRALAQQLRASSLPASAPASR